VNDVNPDDPSVGLVAVLDTTTAKGELKLNEDGSFTYTPSEDFVGKDYFVYHVYADDEGKRESAKVKVTLNVKDMNDGPIVKVDVKTLDTTMTEDQSRVVQYAKQVVASWFEDPEKDPLTFSASSDDDKTIVNITAAGILQIKVAPDSSGDAYVTVAATDSVSGGSAELKIHVTIKPAPDKPVIAKKDSLCVKDTTKWSIKIALTDYFTDADGDSLTYTPAIPKDMADAIEVEVKGDTLIVSAKEKAVFMKGDLVAFSVKATDPTAASVTGSFYIYVGLEKPPVSIRAIAAAPKATWQNAVKASRGAVALLDMQGRVMWKAPLPVSEMDVRNAAAQVQGRKILRVNNQTWTIK
jgi:VCBS repeat-containing protein